MGSVCPLYPLPSSDLTGASTPKGGPHTFQQLGPGGGGPPRASGSCPPRLQGSLLRVWDGSVGLRSSTGSVTAARTMAKASPSQPCGYTSHVTSPRLLFVLLLT